jgi:hypothetical protein
MKTDIDHHMVVYALEQALTCVRFAEVVDTDLGDFDMESSLVDALAQLDRQLKPSEAEEMVKETERDQFFVEWEERCQSIMDAAAFLKGNPALKFLVEVRQIDKILWRDICDKVAKS